MLKLKYIIVDELPECEFHYLKENLKKDKEEFPAEDWKLVLLKEEEGGLTEYPPEESLFISGQKKHLQEAASLGTAVLGYLLPEGKEQYEDSETASLEIDMYAEGMEEVDFTFLNHVYQRHHNLPWTILETERCIVREFSMEYLDELFEMYAKEGMTDYIEPLFDYKEEREYQQAYIENMYRFYGYGMWIVCDKKTGKLIGRAGIEHCEEMDGELELGYAIGVPYQKKGYATEVCRAILSYVETELQGSHICCRIEAENRVSIHLAERLGFSFAENTELDGKNRKKYVLEFDR